MPESDWLAENFEANRSRLRTVAYRMLGSLPEADDAVQEAWLRVSRSDVDEVDNLNAWLTTIVARVSLNALRTRRRRSEDPVGLRIPDPVVRQLDEDGPEERVVLADSVGLALQVVLETLTPAERLAFVLHDMFGVPFDEIAPMVERSPTAARQLASRARRRVRGADVGPSDTDLDRQRELVTAFYAAARGGDFDALVAVLDPDVVLRSDGGAGRPDASVVVHGAEAVVRQLGEFHHPDATGQLVLVNGNLGTIVTIGRQPVAVLGFTYAGGRIVRIDAIADPERLRGLDLEQVLSASEE